jgi:hypothetical protein
VTILRPAAGPVIRRNKLMTIMQASFNQSAADSAALAADAADPAE